MAGLSTRHHQAIELFAPLGPTYDRYARLLSLGQDPRWRAFLVSRIDVGRKDTVLDVATGTGAVAAELVRRTGCSVVGLDQSAGMLSEARRRVPARVSLVQGDAEQLPFPDASFDGLTVTYLLRYVDDPARTLRELARVVRPGRTIASLEFAVPSGPVAHAAQKPLMLPPRKLPTCAQAGEFSRPRPGRPTRTYASQAACATGPDGTANSSDAIVRPGRTTRASSRSVRAGSST